MDTGLPIASMDVHAGLINGDRISSANTDGNGNYVLRGLPEGIIEIGANGHGYVEECILPLQSVRRRESEEPTWA